MLSEIKGNLAPSKNAVRDQRELDAVSMLRKNAIINGNFNVWQRGVTQSVTGYGSDDRWKNAQSGSSKVHTRQTFTVGQTDVPNEPTYYSRTVITTGAGASNYIIKKYRMEDVRTFAGKTVTLSFYAKADASKDIATEFVQNFGAGGSVGVTAIDVTTHNLTTSWQKFTVIVTMPSISGKTLDTATPTYVDINFWLEAGSNYDARTNTLGNQSGTFEIAQVQLEEGSVATAFERRSYGEELALCQRYFERLEGIGAGNYFSWGAGTQQTTTSARIHFIFGSKRVTPTVSYSGNIRCSGGGLSNVVTGVTMTNTQSIGGHMTVTSTDENITVGFAVLLMANNDTDAYFDVDAEL